MKVDITRLKEDQAVEFLEEWDAQAFDLDIPGLKYINPIKIQASVKRNAGVVEARISVNAATDLECARCFKEFRTLLDRTFTFIYSIDYSRKTILLDDDIREELLLSCPQKILCREGCKGLCPRCGVDLNEQKCRCV